MFADNAKRLCIGRKTSLTADVAGQASMMKFQEQCDAKPMPTGDGLKFCVPIAVGTWGMFLKANASPPKTPGIV